MTSGGNRPSSMGETDSAIDGNGETDASMHTNHARPSHVRSIMETYDHASRSNRRSLSCDPKNRMSASPSDNSTTRSNSWSVSCDPRNRISVTTTDNNTVFSKYTDRSYCRRKIRKTAESPDDSPTIPMGRPRSARRSSYLRAKEKKDTIPEAAAKVDGGRGRIIHASDFSQNEMTLRKGRLVEEGKSLSSSLRDPIYPNRNRRAQRQLVQNLNTKEAATRGTKPDTRAYPSPTRQRQRNVHHEASNIQSAKSSISNMGNTGNLKIPSLDIGRRSKGSRCVSRSVSPSLHRKNVPSILIGYKTQSKHGHYPQLYRSTPNRRLNRKMGHASFPSTKMNDRSCTWKDRNSVYGLEASIAIPPLIDSMDDSPASKRSMRSMKTSGDASSQSGVPAEKRSKVGLYQASMFSRRNPYEFPTATNNSYIPKDSQREGEKVRRLRAAQSKSPVPAQPRLQTSKKTVGTRNGPASSDGSSRSFSRHWHPATLTRRVTRNVYPADS